MLREVGRDSVSELGGHNLCPKLALTIVLNVPIKSQIKSRKQEKGDLFNVATLERGNKSIQ